MNLNTFLGLLAATYFVSPAWSFGTIVEVYPSTCPVLPSGPTIPPVQYILSVTPASVDASPGAATTTYIGAEGRTTADCGAAAPFLVSNGQLSSNGEFVSSSGLVPSSPLVASSYVAAISTTFSVMSDSGLTWNNTAFAGGHALFCVMENIVEAIYDGQLPAGCTQVSLGYVPGSSCPTFQPSGSVTQAPGSTSMGTSLPLPTDSVPGVIRGSNVTAVPVGCLSSPSTSPAVSGGLPPRAVATLEQCTDFCYSYAYFGVQKGLCLCGNTLASTAIPAAFGTCNVACTGNSAQNCGGDGGMAVYSIVDRSGTGSTISGISTTEGPVATGPSGSSATTTTAIATTATTSSTTNYVTSTGVPNCFGRSPFDNTVNGGYLILCNTDLPGFDLMTANGTNLAECIAVCNTLSSGPASDICVAVTFDITASSNQCRLKNNIGPVDAGVEDSVEAAILVTGAFAPQIVFASAASTMSSTTGTTTTSTAPTGSTNVDTASTGMTSTGTPSAGTPSTGTPSTGTPSTGTPSTGTPSTGTPSTGTPSTGTPSTGTPSTGTPSTGTPSTDTASTGTTVNDAGSSSTSVIGTTTSTASSSSSVGSATGTSLPPGPVPTDTDPSGPLCPTYNGQVVRIGGNFYQVQCSTDTFGDTIIANTTTAASLAECGGYCNLYNLAVPFGCIGVTLLRTSDFLNCYLKSKIDGTEFRIQDDSLRLIYPGYPTPTDPILTASPTGEASTSTQATASTVTTTMSSSSTGPTATGALCPAYNGQAVYFSSYGGSSYQIECATNFADLDLLSVLATNLTDCVNYCSFLNVNTEIPQCMAVTFLNTPQTDPPSNNCYPKGSATQIVRGIPQDDSARLIFGGPPSGTDMGISSTSSSSTPIRPLSSTASSTTDMQSATTSSTVMASSASTTTSSTSTTTSVPSPTGSLCPTYDSQVIQAGNYQYEIECGYELTGRDIGVPYIPYPSIQTFQDCLAACNYWNENNSTLCIAADYQPSISACYLKDIINERVLSPNINAARLTFSGSPSITDPVSSSVMATTTALSTSASSTAASTSISVSSTSAIATATASVYPPGAVCPEYNGGQLTSEGSNLYDIECNNDLRFAESDLLASDVLFAATFSACALACDQYNLNAGALDCRGFTWDSTSVGTTTTNCVLKSSLIQTFTENTANTNGVHSGRLLGPWPATNQVILSRPVPLVTNTLYNGYSNDYNFAPLLAPGGLSWQITEYANPTLYVGAEGFLALSQTDLNNQDGLTGLSNSTNDAAQPFSLPSTVLPTYAVAAYWTRGSASLNSQQGIYYQIDDVANGRYFISIEFYYRRFETDDIFHWITTYDTGNPGVWTSWHFPGSASNDGGLYQTVGHQGTQTLNGQTPLTISALYQNGQAGTVNAGDRIVFNTNPNINTVVRTQNAFDIATFGTPGTWSYTNSPQ